jgi:isopentenyldiphosphate isomerase
LQLYSEPRAEKTFPIITCCFALVARSILHRLHNNSLTRILSDSDDQWGEHEIDYVMFVRKVQPKSMLTQNQVLLHTLQHATRTTMDFMLLATCAVAAQ